MALSCMYFWNLASFAHRVCELLYIVARKYGSWSLALSKYTTTYRSLIHWKALGWFWRVLLWRFWNILLVPTGTSFSRTYRVWHTSSLENVTISKVLDSYTPAVVCGSSYWATPSVTFSVVMLFLYLPVWVGWGGISLWFSLHFSDHGWVGAQCH